MANGRSTVWLDMASYAALTSADAARGSGAAVRAARQVGGRFGEPPGRRVWMVGWPSSSSSSCS
ncbi:hypothetical protein [Streptomyces sp. NPDC086989]|uniref:hypothetical protein n=1 Tax=Streptomyces sp. NPDC086989 TaxID=3365764 RepID=UPI0038245D7A